MAGSDSTCDRLLDAAECLFANHGFERVSLRRITAAANSNIASVNYYFGTKSGLVDAVISRRANPLNLRRLELLSDAESRAGEKPPSLDEILHAFIHPLLDLASADHSFLKLLGRTMAEYAYDVAESAYPLFQETALRFSAAIQRCLPHLDEQTIMWRLHFSSGAISHSLLHSDALTRITQGRCGSLPMPQLKAELVGFCSNGLGHSIGSTFPSTPLTCP
jgi:AcrR family transcriptional regulator